MTGEPEYVAKTFPVRLRFDLKWFSDTILTETEILKLIHRSPGMTVEVGDPEYEAA